MIENVEYFGQPNCQKLSNGTVELIVTTDIGPRIIRYGFPGQDNILGECPEAAVQTDFGEWKPWGGHRLWHAPESIPRTYVPDNTPIDWEANGDLSVRLVQPVESPTGIVKELSVALDPEGTGVTVHHKLTNDGQWPVQLAPWGLSIMNGGGRVIIPQEPFISHDDCLTPARPLVLWHYTNLADPRYTIGPKFIQLRTDAAIEDSQKIGVADKEGWAAYFRQGTLFIKFFDYIADVTYPDDGCNCEAYTAANFMELETLAPMHDLVPGESAEHVEVWHLFQDIELGEDDDAIEAVLNPILGEFEAEDD